MMSLALPDTFGVRPTAEVAALTDYGRAPFHEIALVGGRPYLRVMRALLAGFAEAELLSRDIEIVEINGPIGLMRQHLRRWLIAEPALTDHSPVPLTQ
jgi:hypothetical protein